MQVSSSDLLWRSRAKLARMISGGCAFPYQPYNLRLRTIYIHIPKCGGTSLLNALAGRGRYTRTHLSWRAYHQADRRKFRDFFKFSIVRDPVDRLSSTYYYLRRGGNSQNDLKVARDLEKRGIDTLDKFIDRYLTNERLHTDIFFAPQSAYLCNSDGSPVVDHIWNISDLTGASDFLSQRFGVKISIGHDNKSQRGPSSIAVENRAKVTELYEVDYQLMGRI